MLLTLLLAAGGAMHSMPAAHPMPAMQAMPAVRTVQSMPDYRRPIQRMQPAAPSVAMVRKWDELRRYEQSQPYICPSQFKSPPDFDRAALLANTPWHRTCDFSRRDTGLWNPSYDGPVSPLP